MGALLASVGAEAAIGLGTAGAGYAGLQAFRALKRSEQVSKLAGVLKKAERVEKAGERVGARSIQKGYAPKDGQGKPTPLPRDEHGVPIPSSDAAHTQIGTRQGRKGDYRQTRQWDADGKEIKTTDWTDHDRGHPNPHDHFVEPNPLGGTPKRGEFKPFETTFPESK